MDISKALYQAPAGLEPEGAEPTIEIEIMDPEAPVEVTDEEPEAEFNANLVEFMDAKDVARILSELADEVKQDMTSRRDWEDTLKEGIKLMGLHYENRTEPWAGACGVFHPMITEAVVRFQSETIMETFPASGPVKTKVIGKQTKDKTEAAARVQEDMNWQLTENMVEFRPEHEKMLWSLPGAGSAFKKVYKDPMLGRQTSVFVGAEDIILPYGTSELLSAQRITHRMRKTANEVKMLQVDKFWMDVSLGDPPKIVDEVQKVKDKETGFTALNDDRFIINEVCVDLDLPGFEDKGVDGEATGIKLPYIMTYVEGTNNVLAIRRNWTEGDNNRAKRLHYVHYQYIPGFGAYGFGLFHLIGGYAKAGTSLLRQLVDAGTLSNLPGGLKSRGLRIKGDDTPIAPGEFRDVDVGSGNIRDNLMPLPYKEPSMVLAGLLDKIIEEGRRFAATADMKVADMSAQAPVGTTLALLERQLKVMSAVQARVHYAFKQELKLIAEIVRDDAPDNEQYDYDVDSDQGRKAKFKDYRYTEIIPVSDPNAATMTQRVVQYQAVIQLSQTAPQIYDLPQLHRQMLRVLGIKEVEKLIPVKDDMKPIDPVTENQHALMGKPVRAFAYQDHEAHIQVHMMAVQDPIVQQLVGQNPQAQAIQAAMMAHIAEHTGYAYRNKMAEALGAPIPTAEDNEGLPADMEIHLSRLLAQAAPQVLAQSKAMMAQQQAQQNAQDPILKLQEMELGIKEMEAKIKAAEVERKQRKDTIDAAAKADEIRIKEQELEGTNKIEGLNILTKIAELERDAEATAQKPRGQ
jgi:hypothetical protein